MKNILYALALIFLLSGCHSSIEDRKMAAIISADKMNVLYIGVDNPISVAVTGIPSDKISVKMDDGKITGSNGEYVVNVGTPEDVKIEVFAEMENGEKKSFPPVVFRVKRVPDPVAYFAGKKGEDFISKTELEKTDKVEVRMDNFDFDLHYEVTSFNMLVQVGNDSKILSSGSNLITDEMKKIMSELPSGSRIIIENFRVNGPDTRTIPGINLTVL
jgi:hypothetical protein